MEVVSNKVDAAAFVSSPEVWVTPSSNPAIQCKLETGQDIRLLVHKPIKTPSLRRPNSLTVFSILPNSEMGGWRLKSVLLAQVSRARRESLAVTWLEAVAEYGTGKGDGEAITDLVVSLGEYLESLEKRAKKLGSSAQRELDCLRRLIERS